MNAPGRSGRLSAPAWATALLTGVVLSGAVPDVQAQEKRVALVVGIDHYRNLGPEGQLSVAVSDAKRIAETLRSVNPPFETTLLADSDWRTTQDAFDQFLDRAAGATCALVYFAGHGVEYHGANYLLVNDTDVSSVSADVERMKRRLSSSSVSLQAWVDSLDQTGAQVKVVILDCCRDNPLRAETPTGTRSLVGGRQGLAQLSPPSGTLISYSADAGQRANDGLFTEVLARHLRTPDVPLLQVFAATREEVGTTSAQWAREDEAKGLPPDERRPHHEPAEYTKLNLAGTKFTFNQGGVVPPPSRPVLKSPAELGMTTPPAAPPATGVAPAQGMSASDAARKVMVWRKLVESMKADSADPSPPPDGAGVSVPTTASGRTTAPSAFPTGFSLAAAMAGQAAGERRTIQGIPMVWCPPGTFSMGPPDHEETFQEDQKPYQAILTHGFWMAQFEVTQEQWRRIMESGVEELSAAGNSPGEPGPVDPAHPIHFASWYDAQAWVTKMNEIHPVPTGWRWALPTEAQWEYACRAGTTTPFSFGSALNGDKANCDGRYPYRSEAGRMLGHTTAVGSYASNPWGLHDMHGNVAEWVDDWWGGTYPVGEAADPRGPVLGEYRVQRGGSWSTSALGCRSAYRAYGAPDARQSAVGFRPAIVVDPGA